MSAINIDVNLGPVVFLGTTNAMPMLYALELRKKGVDVIYFVEVPVSNTLSRPENHFPDIKYPYPEWIVEAALPTMVFLPLFPKIFSAWVLRKLSSRSGVIPQVFILNGFFCSLAPFLGEKSQKVFLSSGSDLDSWADLNNSAMLARAFSKKSIFKYIPGFVSRFLIQMMVKKQFYGACNCSKVIYFPKGFNKSGDFVVGLLEAAGVSYVPRFDMSFEPLKYERRGCVKNEEKLVIFSGVRFLFESFPDGNIGYCKGNDLIIKGIYQYYKKNKNIEVHFVEKGEDVAAAKRLCVDYGIDKIVVWHKEMKFFQLLNLYHKADICFDQVGEHWLGAIGFYSLWLGKPLIANDSNAKILGLWGSQSPIYSATTSEEISEHLVTLENPWNRKIASIKSMAFAEKELSPDCTMKKLFSIK